MALLSPAAATFFPNSPPNSTHVPGFLLSFSVSYTRFYNLSHSTNHSFSFPIHSHRPFQPLSSNSTVVRPGRCRASSPGPPPPPRTDPPPETDLQLKGSELAASFSKIRDRVQIFFAVLFWMSLFFWASAWDGRNRPNKGPPKFRR